MNLASAGTYIYNNIDAGTHIVKVTSRLNGIESKGVTKEVVVDNQPTTPTPPTTAKPAPTTQVPTTVKPSETTTKAGVKPDETTTKTNVKPGRNNIQDRACS